MYLFGFLIKGVSIEGNVDKWVGLVKGKESCWESLDKDIPTLSVEIFKIEFLLFPPPLLTVLIVYSVVFHFNFEKSKFFWGSIQLLEKIWLTYLQRIKRRYKRDKRNLRKIVIEAKSFFSFKLLSVVLKVLRGIWVFV